MQFSENWLRTMVDPPLGSAALAHVLTMAGLEVESVQPAAPPFTKVVVGVVGEVAKHPNADKLNICSVDVGQAQPLTVVCGAPNVAVGMKTACALIGAELPGLKIKAAKVRGVESFGMLCSARELGLSDDASGLMVLSQDLRSGTDLRLALDLDDKVFALKLTPNRSDCLSVAGVAREVAALTATGAQLPGSVSVEPQTDLRRAVVLDAPQACPRYLGRVVSGINAHAATPDWMRRRLERSGLRSIGAVVDITNYVMLELGQPLHAFDDVKLRGSIHVRFPRNGEKLKLLNGQTVEPPSDTLLIADEARALALAGIMGGEDSGVTLDTTVLFLESAFFAPDVIQGRARKLGFASDASHRFERGVDFGGARAAIERATELLATLCGGVAGPVTEALGELPARPPVALRSHRLSRILGIEIAPDRVAVLLTSAGLSFQRDGDDFKVTPPSYRFDIAIEEDLIEEIARIFGYDNIPAVTPLASISMLPEPEGRRSTMLIKRLLAARGYHETINFSFVDRSWETDFAGNTSPVVLANPIASHLCVMRSSLIGGLVANLALNLKRKTSRLRVFEIGRCFLRTDGESELQGILQPTRLAVLAAGSAAAEQWGIPTRVVDFFDVKGDLEALLRPLQASFQSAAHPALHPGRAAQIVIDGVAVGVVGELHPQLVQRYELGAAAVVFEIELDVLTRRQLPAYRESSRFPAVTRDLALVVDFGQSLQTLLEVLREAAPSIVRGVELFDVYQGKGVPENKKSLAFRVVMQDTERTLAEVDVDAAMAAMAAAAEQRFGAKLRG